jgi:8-oxo-dGTP pyrophosphatase MutT (NUDIX family)
MQCAATNPEDRASLHLNARRQITCASFRLTFMLKKPTSIASHHIFDGRIISVSTERLLYANGREYDLDYVRHPGAAAVVAVDAAGRVCLVRQYRHGITDFLWEIPAGKLDAGEPPQVCAVRELAEETGVSARRWTSLGTFLPAPGIFTEIIHLYLAQDLEVGAAAPDADEDLEVQWLPLQEAVARVLHCDWNDGKTALALWRAQYQLQL